MRAAPSSPFEFDETIARGVDALDERVRSMRQSGQLRTEVLERIRRFFRLKTIYNSNAIEGNTLNIGETRLVVEQGLTISGKPLKDSLEARNLAHALDLFEQLATDRDEPIREIDIRQIHAAILEGIDEVNAGRYRTVDVEISGSGYRPPGPHEVPAQMEEFARWLAVVAGPQDASPIVIAAAAHAWFAQIHPFIDGNGRTARILMNLILMRAAYPIAIITIEDRKRYYEALEESQSGDLTPFLSLIIECIDEALEEYEHAVEAQTAQLQWIGQIAARLSEPEQNVARLRYEVFRAAMELLRSHFAQAVSGINQAGIYGARVYFKDFGMLEFEKYFNLRQRGSAKQTWFFRVDFTQGDRSARYLFWFTRPTNAWNAGRHRGDDVSMLVSRERDEGSFFYDTLDQFEQVGRRDIPDIREIAYDQNEERFYCRYSGGRINDESVDNIVRSFVSQVVQRNF